MHLSFFLLLGLVLWVVFALWPAMWAKRKGYSFWLFLILSWFISFVLTLIIVMFLKDKRATAADRAASQAADAALAKEENR